MAARCFSPRALSRQRAPRPTQPGTLHGVRGVPPVQITTPCVQIPPPNVASGIKFLPSVFLPAPFTSVRAVHATIWSPECGAPHSGLPSLGSLTCRPPCTGESTGRVCGLSQSPSRCVWVPRRPAPPKFSHPLVKSTRMRRRPHSGGVAPRLRSFGGAARLLVKILSLATGWLFIYEAYEGQK